MNSKDREYLKNYKERLEKEIFYYAETTSVSEHSAEVLMKLMKCWDKLNKFEENMCAEEFEYEDAEHWNECMQNADGTTGGHWTIEQTTSVAKSIGLNFDHISDWCWNVTMNMMYSDYYKVAEKFGINTAGFYADMSKAFLFDKDGGKPQEKLSAYYYNIIEKQ